MNIFRDGATGGGWGGHPPPLRLENMSGIFSDFEVCCLRFGAMLSPILGYACSAGEGKFRRFSAKI